MTVWDLIVAPFVLFIIFSLLSNARKGIKDPVLRSYFNLAFRVKLIGAFGVGVLYQFYYGRGTGVGDTFNFYREGQLVASAFFVSPMLWFDVLTASREGYAPEIYPYISQNLYFLEGDFRTFNVVRIASFFSILTFNTYSSIAFLFALLSFTGVWAMYRVFYDMYPALHRSLAYAVFFIPSVYFWGSGLVKDSLSLGALGWLFYGFYFTFIKRQKFNTNIWVFLLAVWALYNIKLYILGAFLAGAMLWFFLQYRANIKNPLLRFLMLPVMLVAGSVIGYYTLLLSAQSIEAAANTARISSEWLEQIGQREGGAVYSLGITDWTPIGLLPKTPQAVWVGIFQPHPWQARNLIMLLSAAEATFFLWLTARVLFSHNIFSIFNLFLARPVLLLCLIFTIILSIAVVMPTNNYGSLVRYRIPYQPFYLAMLYILRYELSGNKKLY